MSGGGGQSSSTTVRELAPEQKELLGLVLPVAKQYMTNPPADYPGPRTAAVNPAEALGQAMLLGSAGGLQSASDSSMGALRFLSGDVLDVNRNPGLQGALGAALRPITENYGENVLPGIRAEAITSGVYSGSGQRNAETTAARDYLRQIGDTSAGIISDAYGKGLEAMTRAQAFAPGVMQAATLPAQAVGAVGSQQRAVEQAAIQDSITKYFNEQYLPFLLAQEVAGLAYGYPGGSTTTLSKGGGTSPFASALGGAASGASMGSMFGPWGAGAGGIIGLLSGLFMN